jgi:7,8-dihydropterin-6-yl-methyl-4-(beta-D-ribofuranosyl)aminobenzene 5'-phosphate synthase
MRKVKISVLLENDTTDPQFKAKHGLSLLIEFGSEKILLDVGPDGKFLENAAAMGISMSDVGTLFLSHSHSDHTGGLEKFIQQNDKSNIYLFDNPASKYYSKVLGIINIPIGVSLSSNYYSRITSLSDDFHTENADGTALHFLRNTKNEFPKPTFNKALYMEANGKVVPDTFNHEGILVVDDGESFVVLNSCSHNGVINCIQTVQQKLPEKPIRASIGGFHLCNPNTRQHEGDSYLEKLHAAMKETGIAFYTGHCTGKESFAWLQNAGGIDLHEIHTGMVFVV